MTVRVRHVNGGFVLFLGDEPNDDVVLIRRSNTHNKMWCLYCASGECSHISALLRYLTNQPTDS